MNAKKICIFCLIVGVILGVFLIRNEIVSSYEYENTYSQYWSLADKSSTIPAKQQYISQFVAALEKGNVEGKFASHNAKYLRTPNNSFAENVKAVKTLSQRLSEIQTMNPASFEYNTAIQQITAQEQGEAHAMLSVFQGCYVLNNYPSVWEWVGACYTVLALVLVIGGAIGWFATSDFY